MCIKMSYNACYYLCLFVKEKTQQTVDDRLPFLKCFCFVFVFILFTCMIVTNVYFLVIGNNGLTRIQEWSE